ncbi:MAG: Gfo/Idh/MocA family oxidoreductase [Verrucomicrobiota bacterium]
MPEPFSRRRLLKSSLVAATAASVSPNLLLGKAKGANSRLRVGVMGLSRGKGHIKAFLEVPNCEVAYICDVDETRLNGGIKTVEGKQDPLPQTVTDFRRILEDDSIDALSIAAPNFWHAPATILGCEAGKHVFVEKPGSYSPHEASRMVEVAEATDRQVQMGTQRRSYPGMLDAKRQIDQGLIGLVRAARCYYSNQRQSIGVGKPADPPPNLDWTLWQGPVPDAAYKDNLVHYNWHWHWLYGGGEMANNGVHSLDVARWMTGVNYPTRITCNGGRYHYDDDQETPDTCHALFDYGDLALTWESSSCHKRKPEPPAFVTLYGDKGKMDIGTANFTAFDLDGQEIAKNVDPPSDVPHFTNFADAIREGTPLNQPIADAQVSTMLCHLANIAYRTGGSVSVDPSNGNLVNHPAGEELWKRPAYRPGWEV